MNLDMKFVVTFLTCSLLLVSGVSCYFDFEISVPSHDQVAVYGESLILSCTFPMSGSWDEENTVITWQRHREVVHSFFHGRDQIRYQSSRYVGRTHMFHEEMKKGNASVRLDRVTLDDAGEYTCSVSTQVGSQRKSFHLKVAAYYPEPHLHISMMNDGHMEVLVTSEGGYPLPSLQWLKGSTNDVTNDTDTHLWQDENTQLYRVTSKLNLTGNVNFSITFILKNQELGQEIQRNISLISEKQGPHLQPHFTALLVTLGVMSPIMLVALLFCIRYCNRKRTEKNADDRPRLNSQLATNHKATPLCIPPTNEEEKSILQ